MRHANIPPGIWDHEVAALNPPAIDWLWHGFVAPGNTTLLTSLWKAGKTTLVSMLLSRRKQAGTLAGLLVKPGRTVVVSEEPMSLWAAADYIRPHQLARCPKRSRNNSRVLGSRVCVPRQE
jgi:hypothetical protein